MTYSGLSFSLEDKQTISLVKDCFQKSDSHTCTAALIVVNKLQKKASKSNQYSCQSRLLGLEANLILSMNQKLKKRRARTMLSQVRKYC